jgi:hypothetical protein
LTSKIHERDKAMKAAQFQIAGVDFPECPARDSLRAAQGKLKSAKVHAEKCREAVERGEKYLVGLEAQLADALMLEQTQTIERVKAFAVRDDADVELDAPAATRRRRELEDRIESARTSVSTLQTLAHAAQAERDAAEEIAWAVAEVMKEEAEPMLSRLQDLERSAALLRCALKAYGKLAFVVIPGVAFHASPAGLTEHLGKDPENSLQGMGWLNSWQQHKTEAHIAKWKSFRDALRDDANAMLTFE